MFRWFLERTTADRMFVKCIFVISYYQSKASINFQVFFLIRITNIYFPQTLKVEGKLLVVCIENL